MQPAHGPPACVLELGLVIGPVGGHPEGRQQEFLDASLDRADREAFLELAVGSRLVERVEGLQEARRRSETPPAALGDLDRRGDVAGLSQRLAQRLDLREGRTGGGCPACGAGAGNPACAPSSEGCWGSRQRSSAAALVLMPGKVFSMPRAA